MWSMGTPCGGLHMDMCEKHPIDLPWTPEKDTPINLYGHITLKLEPPLTNYIIEISILYDTHHKILNHISISDPGVELESILIDPTYFIILDW